MHPCSLCCLTTRQGVVLSGLILTILFVLQVVTTLLHRELLESAVTETQFWTIAGVQAFMSLMSILLIVAAVYKARWLLLPFIIYAVLTDLSFVILLIGAVLHVVTASGPGGVEVSIAALGTFFLLSWVLWTVILYFMELGRTDGYDGLDEAGPSRDFDGFPAPPPRRAESGTKPKTVVSKMLHNLR